MVRLFQAKLLLFTLSVISFLAFGYILERFTRKRKNQLPTEPVNVDADNLTPLMKKEASPFFNLRHNFSCEDLFNGKINVTYTNSPKWKSDYAWYTDLAQNGCKVLDEYFWPTRSKLPAVAYCIILNEHVSHFVLQLHATYASTNVYCVHVDVKAPFVFHRAIEMIANCINEHVGRKQIFVIERPIPVVYWGHTTLEASQLCLQRLFISDNTWRYVFTLQAGSFPLRTPAEIATILGLLNDTNELELDKYPNFVRVSDYVEDVFDSAGGTRPAELSPSVFTLKRRTVLAHLGPFGVAQTPGLLSRLMSVEWQDEGLYRSTYDLDA